MLENKRKKKVAVIGNDRLYDNSSQTFWSQDCFTFLKIT
jgi:hypothetical protein